MASSPIINKANGTVASAIASAVGNAGIVNGIVGGNANGVAGGFNGATAPIEKTVGFNHIISSSPTPAVNATFTTDPNGVPKAGEIAKRNPNYAYSDTYSASSKDMVDIALKMIGKDGTGLSDADKTKLLQQYAYVNGYNNLSDPTGKSMGNTLDAFGMKVKDGQIVWDTSSDAYKNYMAEQTRNQYMNQIADLYNGYDAYAKQILDLQNQMTNSQFDANASGYYTMYKQNQRKLANQLSQNGLTGGASETAQLGVLNNYASNYANNESARGTALNTNGLEYMNSLKDNYVNKTNALSGFLQDYIGEDHKLANDKSLAKYNNNLDIKAYKTKAEYDLALEKSHADDIAKANAKVVKDNKGKGGWFYLDKSGYWRHTTDPSLATQMGGISANSTKSLATLEQAWLETATKQAEKNGTVISSGAVKGKTNSTKPKTNSTKPKNNSTKPKNNSTKPKNNSTKPKNNSTKPKIRE